MFRCDCGGFIDVEPTGLFDPQQLPQRGVSIWRYREAYSLPPQCEPVSLGEGRTPLLKLNINGSAVQLKLDSLQPSASFKDRGASVLVSLVKGLGIQSLVEDSSGNAGAAMSAYAAAAGLNCRIYVPDYTPVGKLIQMRLYGSEVVRVAGTRQEAAEASIAAAHDSYYASHLWNPYFVLGLQSCAFELWEQLAQRPPNTVIVPLGSGGNLEGIHLGFTRLKQAGLIDHTPRLIGAQAAACAPVHHAFEAGSTDVARMRAEPTVAEGIAVAQPPRARAVLAALRDSGGRTIVVDDQEILAATRLLFERGVFAEATSAAAVAAWLRLDRADREEAVVAITGHGLKGADKLGRLFPDPYNNV